MGQFHAKVTSIRNLNLIDSQTQNGNAQVNTISLNDYEGFKIIGEGSFGKVFKGKHKISHQEYAIKFIEKSSYKELIQFKREISILNSLNHPNLMKCYVNQVVFSPSFIKNGKTKRIQFGLFEYASKGDLFDLLLKCGGSLPENIAKFYFLQMVEGLQHLHNLQIAHRDIKLENIFVKSDDQVILGDFGFAMILSATEQVYDFKGTLNYQDPQINKATKGINAKASDIFALGVCLFSLCHPQFPFEKAVARDSLYKKIIDQQWDSFFSYHGTKASKEYKNLLVGMLEYQSELRYTINDVKNHSWLKHGIASREEVQKFWNTLKN